jgi:hypothetical protein
MGNGTNDAESVARKAQDKTNSPMHADRAKPARNLSDSPQAALASMKLPAHLERAARDFFKL